jgi:hypothetical protein
MGREDFEADDDVSARLTAQLVFDACTDVVQRFELFCSDRMVLALREPITLRDTEERYQRNVVALEERIRDSGWAASSERLLRTLSVMPKD